MVRRAKFEKEHSVHSQSPGCDVRVVRPLTRFLAHMLALNPFPSIALMIQVSTWVCSKVGSHVVYYAR